MAEQGKDTKKKSSPKLSVTPRGELLEGRVPPHSKELEEAVLGAMLLEREKLSLVMDVLTERHFYFPEHRAIFRSILGLYTANSVVDLLTVNNDYVIKKNWLKLVVVTIWLSLPINWQVQLTLNTMLEF